MVRRLVPNIVFIFLCTIASFTVLAQPSLPDISANIDKDAVLLLWKSPYTSVKAVSVMRSRDSIDDYEVIGYVKKPEPGVQSFVDAHPPAGKNYYKLAIVFNKGLTWRSNHAGIFVNRAIAEVKPEPPAEPKPPEPRSAPKEQPKFEKESDRMAPRPTQPVKLPDTCKKTTVKQSVSMSFAPDTTSMKPEPPRPKVHMSFEEPFENAPIFIRSKYIHTDSATGHVFMSLPDDVSTHHYSVKFFDKDKHLLFEVPKINSAKLIIDKRNFQHKGIYKFTLRKDYLEIESGFIPVEP